MLRCGEESFRCEVLRWSPPIHLQRDGFLILCFGRKPRMFSSLTYSRIHRYFVFTDHLHCANMVLIIFQLHPQRSIVGEVADEQQVTTVYVFVISFDVL